MADLSQTPASVAKGNRPRTVTGVYGETIVVGDALYLKASDTRYWKTLNNAAAAAAMVGYALTGGAAGQPGIVQTAGEINPGATVAIGVTYCVSANAGKTCPDSDVTTGGTKYKTVIGVGISATTIKMGIIASGVAVA